MSVGSAPKRRSARLSQQVKPAPLGSVAERNSRKRKREIEQSSPENWHNNQDQKIHTASEAITYWCTHRVWPNGYLTDPAMSAPVLARKRSMSSTPRTQPLADVRSQSSGFSEQQSRESKSAVYRDANYEDFLRRLNIFTEEGQHVNDSSVVLLARLNSHVQTLPTGTLFDDEVFPQTCRMIYDRNESNVARDIGLLMVPSPGQLDAFGALELGCMAETVNEAWINCIPLTKPRPQPDFSVGFRRDAFTGEQLNKLEAYIGEPNLESCFMATYTLLFPFFTSEVKCGNAALDIADRQNLHSAYVCGRGIFELYKLVGRQQELHQQYLSFSISHNDRFARIYTYMASIDGDNLSYYRKQVREYSITDLEGKERWTAYKFVRNGYEFYGLPLLKRLQSAIDQIPEGVTIGVSKSESGSRATGLSQELLSSTLTDQDGIDDTSQPMPTPDPSNTQRDRKKQRGGRR